MKIRWMIMLMSFLSSSMFAACCMGDGCPNVLGEYKDKSGMPTGKYELLTPSGTKIPIQGAESCTCSNDDLSTWPPKNCPSCAVMCPNCHHDIFMHTCDEKGIPGAGTKARR